MPLRPLEAFVETYQVDDGTIWSLPRLLGPPRPDRQWQRLPDVPGDDGM